MKMMSEIKGYTFITHPLFDKEVNKIIRTHQCPSLETDLIRLQNVLVNDLEVYGRFLDRTCERIAGLDKRVKYPAFVAKKVRCEKINKGSKSGLRATFLFSREDKCFHFVEMYHKKNKDVENKERINKLFY